MVAVWVSMLMVYNWRYHCWTMCRVYCDWPIWPIAVDAIDESLAKFHRPNCYVVGLLLWRSASPVFYHSVFYNGHCCRSNNCWPLMAWQNLCRFCMRHWTSCWSSSNRWKMSIGACARRNQFFVLPTHLWLAIHRVHFDTMDFRPTADTGEKNNSQLIQCIQILLVPKMVPPITYVFR